MFFQEAMEIMVACSAMALSKEQASKEEETQSPKSSWTKWKRGGIIGAAALTGGTLMAITGGMDSRDSILLKSLIFFSFVSLSC